jgi:DNA-binding beta-propeller fold protein YncE
LTWLSLPLLELLLCALSPVVNAQPNEILRRVGTIQVPGSSVNSPLTSFDGSLVDARRDLYLLSDSSHKSVDVFRASTGVALFTVPGFAGRGGPGWSHSGPTTLIPVEYDIWAGDGHGEIRIIDLETRTIAASISTGASSRVDAMAYDPRDHVVIAATPDANPPFVTLISSDSGHAILKKIEFPHATDWLEDIEWSPETGLFYVAVPELNQEPALGEVAVIDPRKQEVVSHFPISKCQPNGLALGPNGQMLVGCRGEGLGKKLGFPARSFVINIRDGSIAIAIEGVTGSDQIAYNAGDGSYYLAAEANPSGPALISVKATGTHAALKADTDRSAHSVAVDPRTNRVYVPLGPLPSDQSCKYGCVAIFSTTVASHAVGQE